MFEGIVSDCGMWSYDTNNVYYMGFFGGIYPLYCSKVIVYLEYDIITFQKYTLYRNSPTGGNAFKETHSSSTLPSQKEIMIYKLKHGPLYDNGAEFMYKYQSKSEYVEELANKAMAYSPDEYVIDMEAYHVIDGVADV